ncbi:hypothetical protein [Corynebacterium variabile]
MVVPEQARQFVEQHASPALAALASKAPVTGSSILGSEVRPAPGA